MDAKQTTAAKLTPGQIAAMARRDAIGKRIEPGYYATISRQIQTAQDNRKDGK